MARTRRSRPLRGQVRAAILVATAGALLVFALPLAIALRTAYVEQAETVLQREAAKVLSQISDTSHLSQGQLPLPDDPNVKIAAYSTDGTKVNGDGPLHSENASAASAARRGEQTNTEGDMLAAYLPVSPDDPYVVRAAMNVQ